MSVFFFFNDTATTEIYTLSLHDALPILGRVHVRGAGGKLAGAGIDALVHRAYAQVLAARAHGPLVDAEQPGQAPVRSEEHTSELQSRQYLVCRLLLEKKKR